jgi:hypothetical protein
MWPLVPLVLACADDPQDSGGADEVLRTVVPVLGVDAPERGAFLTGGSVTIAGTTAPGSAPLRSLTVNGTRIEVAAGGGPFEATLEAAPGLLILGARLEADDDGRAVDGRAVQVGPVHAPGASLDGSVRMQLGPEALDDDAADLDDLAALTVVVLEDPSTADAFVGLSFPSDYAVVTVTSAAWGTTDVDIVPSDGALSLALRIEDVTLDVDVAGVDWYDWVSTSGTVAADAEVLVELAVSADDGIVTSTARSAEVTLEGFAVTLDWFPDSLEDDLSDYMRAEIELALADAVSEQVGALVAESLGALATDASFSGIDIRAALASLRCADDGVRMTLDVSASGPVAIELPQGAGSLRTDADGPDFPLTRAGGAPFALAADDDLLNQLLFAVWAGGSLHGISFGAFEMTALAGEIPAPLGPVEGVQAYVGLPPVVSGATHEGFTFDLSLGELRMAITREDGVLTDTSINVRTGASVAFLDDGSVDLTLDARPAYMTLEVGMEAWPEGLDPGDMAALVRLSAPPMLGTLGALLPSMSLPAFPLDGTLAPLEGRSLRLVDPEARMDQGWLTLEASISAE